MATAGSEGKSNLQNIYFECWFLPDLPLKFDLKELPNEKEDKLPVMNKKPEEIEAEWNDMVLKV